MAGAYADMSGCVHDKSMQQNAESTTRQPRVRGWWLITSGILVVVALAAPLWIVPCLPDPVAAAAWVVVIGVILNGAGMAIRAGVHGAPRGTVMAWMDGAGKVLSLVGWSSALVFVGFNALHNTSPADIGPATWVITGSALLIGTVLFVWGGILLIMYCGSKPAPPVGSGDGNVDAPGPGGESAHAALAGEDGDETSAGGETRPGGVAVSEDDDDVRAGGQ